MPVALLMKLDFHCGIPSVELHAHGVVSGSSTKQGTVPNRRIPALAGTHVGIKFHEHILFGFYCWKYPAKAPSS